MPDNNIIFPRPVIPAGTPKNKGAEKPAAAGPKAGFGQILAEQIAREKQVKFSQHAQMRLQTRNIALSERDYAQINTAVAKAADKGARESLILLGDRAFVVSIANRTVITVVDGASLKENVFTNIDSAVIM